MKQSEKIIFRIKPEMKSFVKEFSEKMGMDISELMRLIIEYYFFSFFMGTGTYKDMRERFFIMFPSDDKNKYNNQKGGKK
jgi:uncharacterized protein with von Willebrand factor type A (vWA) domain